MRKIKQAVIGLFITLSVFVPLTLTAQAQEIEKNLSCGANLRFDQPEEGCELDGSGNTAAQRVDEIVSQVINLLSLAVGVVAVIMIILGGFRYITSGGDTGNVTSAKNTILYAIVGLVVVALAQVIVRFVVGRATDDSSSTASD